MGIDYNRIILRAEKRFRRRASSSGGRGRKRGWDKAGGGRDPDSPCVKLARARDVLVGRRKAQWPFLEFLEGISGRTRQVQLVQVPARNAKTDPRILKTRQITELLGVCTPHQPV